MYRLLCFVFFVTSLMFSDFLFAQATNEKLQLSKRIEIRRVKGLVKFSSCQFQICTDIGETKGYSLANLQSKVAAASAKYGSSVITQLMIDGLQFENEVVSPFTEIVDWEGQRLISARCPLTSKMMDFIKNASPSKKPQDYVFEIGDHRQANCAGNEKDTPGEIDEIALKLATHLR